MTDDFEYLSVDDGQVRILDLLFPNAEKGKEYPSLHTDSAGNTIRLKDKVTLRSENSGEINHGTVVSLEPENEHREYGIKVLLYNDDDDNNHITLSDNKIKLRPDRLISDTAAERGKNHLHVRKNPLKGHWEIRSIGGGTYSPEIKYTNKPTLYFDLSTKEEAYLWKLVESPNPHKLETISYKLRDGGIKNILLSHDTDSDSKDFFTIVAITEHEKDGTIRPRSYVNTDWIEQKQSIIDAIGSLKYTLRIPFPVSDTQSAVLDLIFPNAEPGKPCFVENTYFDGFSIGKNIDRKWGIKCKIHEAEDIEFEYTDKPELHFQLTQEDEDKLGKIKFSSYNPSAATYIKTTNFELQDGTRNIIWAYDPDFTGHGRYIYKVIAIIDHDRGGNILPDAYVNAEWIKEKTNDESCVFKIDDSLKNKLGIGTTPSTPSYSSGGSSSPGKDHSSDNNKTAILAAAGISATAAIGTGIAGWRRNRDNSEQSNSPTNSNRSVFKAAAVALGTLATGLAAYAFLGKGRSK